jgi:tetratricopeptide (TPR) repeat protein
MILKKSGLLISVLLISILAGVISSTSWASDPSEEWVGKIVSVQGSVQVQKIGTTHWEPVHLNDTCCIGDMIRVQQHSRAAVVLCNGATLRLDQNSTITFSSLEKKQTLLIRLLKGAAHFFSRIPHSLKLDTPFVNGGVEGTEFFVRVDPDQTFLSIFEGKVLAENEAGSLVLSSGQSAVAGKGKAPELRVVLHPRDAVRWALYYPPVIYTPSEQAPVEEDAANPRFLAHRASWLLSVGRVDEAKAHIEQALKLDPKYSDAVALQSIIAVVGNQKQKALDFAKESVHMDPKSATARIALSYAQQASFDLNGAQASLETAVNLAPENALAWARLAEIYSSFGDLDKSLDAAQKAVALNPNLSRTQTVLGFAYLTQIETKESKKAFEKAIELDQAASLPRLGLGLAKIRDGDLKDGAKEIEIAASLDPNNSLIRSYLGKVYYEEKRTNLDGREYAVAKELDPQDPTPWFYDAIRKQTVNRPVEALQDLQKSIELNDNRAVYRSRFLLDQDLAVRSTSLGRIYNNLGFEQLALVEGWKSVNTDPGNYSAHRFLADSYSVLPRHEIARVSELLQSQLLQPINITPIQPQLAESNLKIMESIGPSSLSFNEFNPMFQRNRLALQANGVVGEDDTLGNDLIFSGVYDKVSFSAGQFHYETDGFRKNNNQDLDIYNVFAQASLSPKTSIQAEFRHADRENGQLDLLFDPDISPHFREKEEGDSIRVGFHHGFSPKSDLIGSFIYQSVDFDQNQTGNIEVTPPFISGKANTALDLDEKGYIAELQHLFRSEKFNLTSGIGYTDKDIDRTLIFDIFDLITPPPPFPPGLPPIVIDPPPGPPIPYKYDYEKANIYLYSQIKIIDQLGLTVGLSATSLDREDELDEDQLNPKLGLTWQALPDTIVRAAAFRELSNNRFFSQTIEPTQVAGFNQFFDDLDGADSWRYGAAVDQKFSVNLYGGIEYSIRDLDVPLLGYPGTRAQYYNWDEEFGRAYLYWTPYDMLALSAEYQYERLDRKEYPVSMGIVDAKTHRVPLGFNFLHPSGITFRIKSTYYNQDGEFKKRDSDVIFSDRDDFWVFDTALQYRLPKRYGLVSVGVNNIFDREFLYEDTDPVNPTVIPERFVFGKITLSF